MTNRTEIQSLVREELKRHLTEELTKKDFITMAREIRRANPQYRDVLTNFAIQIAKTQNPRFDEQRFRDAVETGKGV